MDRVAIKIKGIVKCQNKYLLVQKWYDDNIVNPYKWEFVDNVLIPGERPEEAVVDNIYVETGLHVTVSEIPYTWTYCVGETHYVGIAFICETEDDIVMLSDDYSNYVWVEADKLQHYIEDMLMLKDLQKYLNIKVDNKEEMIELNL